MSDPHLLRLVQKLHRRIQKLEGNTRSVKALAYVSGLIDGQSTSARKGAELNNLKLEAVRKNYAEYITDPKTGRKKWQWKGTAIRTLNPYVIGQWVSVEERLPDDGRVVITRWSNGFTSYYTFVRDRKWCVVSGDSDITHWLDLDLPEVEG
jgi:hypothetical protein